LEMHPPLSLGGIFSQPIPLWITAIYLPFPEPSDSQRTGLCPKSGHSEGLPGTPPLGLRERRAISPW
jgi:hypothetical protein